MAKDIAWRSMDNQDFVRKWGGRLAFPVLAVGTTFMGPMLADMLAHRILMERVQLLIQNAEVGETELRAFVAEQLDGALLPEGCQEAHQAYVNAVQNYVVFAVTGRTPRS